MEKGILTLLMELYAVLLWHFAGQLWSANRHRSDRGDLSQKSRRIVAPIAPDGNVAIASLGYRGFIPRLSRFAEARVGDSSPWRESGFFRFILLPLAKYRLRVAASGFEAKLLSTTSQTLPTSWELERRSGCDRLRPRSFARFISDGRHC